jgi:hypothetical protein
MVYVVGWVGDVVGKVYVGSVVVGRGSEEVYVG